MSGVHAREQRAAKSLDARNEGTRVVICVSRALFSIEPKCLSSTGMGKKLANFFLLFHPAFRFFPTAKPGPQANAYLALVAGI